MFDVPFDGMHYGVVCQSLSLLSDFDRRVRSVAIARTASAREHQTPSQSVPSALVVNLPFLPLYILDKLIQGSSDHGLLRKALEYLVHVKLAPRLPDSCAISATVTGTVTYTVSVVLAAAGSDVSSMKVIILFNPSTFIYLFINHPHLHGTDVMPLH